MANGHESRMSNLPQPVKEFIETPEGEKFLKQQAWLALLVSVLGFFLLCAVILSIVMHSNANDNNSKNVTALICFVSGIFLAQIPDSALYNQIIISRLYRKISLPEEMRMQLPFENPKVLIATILSILLIMAGVICCLTP